MKKLTTIQSLVWEKARKSALAMLSRLMQTYLLSIRADFGCLFSSCRFAGSHVSQCLCADGGGRWRGGSAPVMSSPVFVTCQEFVQPCFRLSYRFFSFLQPAQGDEKFFGSTVSACSGMEPQFGNIMVGHLLLCLRSLQQSLFCLQVFGDRLPVARTSVPVTLEGVLHVQISLV